MNAPAAGDTTPVEDPPGARAHLQFRPTVRDYIRILSGLSRRSAIVLAFSTYVATDGIIIIVAGTPWGVLAVLFGLALVTGAFGLAFAVPVLWRRRDLVFVDVDVQADENGMTMATGLSTSHQAWGYYRGSRETASEFLLSPGTGMTIFVLKRGSDASQLAAFRALLAGAGLGPRDGSAIRLLLGALAGVVIAVGLAFGPHVLPSLLP